MPAVACPSCAAELPEQARFCLSCGSSVSSLSKMATALPTPSVERATRRPPSGSGVGRLYSSDSIDAGAFTPGTIVAERYRIIGLVGRGGMGEVYRADDLKLGQPVALKFLPRELSGEPSRLERFYAEVRLARQVSHPNVCRVYDISELDGQHYLSMEYIDGEDLESLLRRIGRLPPDKALEISRQLCAGLAAAHDKGVLHRDLKPSNVMLDGRGRVRITDFGLAVAAAEVSSGEVSGTPVYMAPEQLAGKGASARSDIYSLGLVLYEVYTGRKAFDALTLEELKRKKEDETPRAPSDFNPDMNPAVERVILRCLERDLRLRPATALQVASALPGGDPLAAALAAGETPSPEMVAASGEVEGLRPAVAWTCLAFIAVGVTISVFLNRETKLYSRVPLEKPPEVLAERARQILRNAGYSAAAADDAYAFDIGFEYLRWVREHDKSSSRWNGIERGALEFWYRQSPQPLIPRRLLAGLGGAVTIDDPAPEFSGMATVSLTSRGRLTRLLVVPPQVDDEKIPARALDWNTLFLEAGLEPTKWFSTEPRWTPPVYADARTAWQGFLPGRPKVPMRIEAAAYRGRPVYFELIGPWTRPERMQPYQKSTAERVWVTTLILLLATVIVGGSLLARRNLRLGRGDRRGASRVAFFALVLWSLAWLVGASHVAQVFELMLFLMFASSALFVAGLLWTLYVALEPLVRRRWPQTIVAWSRLLSIGPRDPLVGRDVLAGCITATFVDLGYKLAWLARPGLGAPPPIPHEFDPGLLLGARAVLSRLLSMVPNSALVGLALLFFLFLLRLLLRKEWAAAAVFVLFFSLPGVFAREMPLLAFLSLALFYGAFAFVLMRFGLVAAIATWYFNFLLDAFPLTTDTSAWYAGVGLVALGLAAAIALSAFRISLGTRPLFAGARLEK